MKSEEMLRAMSDIRPEFVEEAAVSADEKEAVNEAAGKEYAKVSVKKGGYKRVTKWVAGIAAVFVVCLGISVFTGGDWFGSGDFNKNADTEEFATADFDAGLEDRSIQSFGEESAMAPGDAMVAAESMNGPNMAYEGTEVEAPVKAGRQNVKLIYRADVSVQAPEYEKTIEEIKALVEEKGGYFEASSSSNGGYYETVYSRSGSFTIRVPQENYRAFLDAATEKFHITRLNESTEDIGTQYFETEARLKTLRTKEERLQQLLAEAGDISDMVEIENALSNTEYEIDMYSSTLNRYDSLVGYSTIDMYVTEVSRVEGGIGGNRSFGQLLVENLKDGAANFVDGLSGLAFWISYNIITIIIIVVLVIICIKAKFARKLKNFVLSLVRR